jgi:hypothetical protein
MSDIFREVEEEVRRDKLVELALQYGTHILAGALVIVAGVGSYALWDWSVQSQRAAESDQYRAAVDLVLSEESDQAIAAFAALAGDASGGYRVLALFRQAGTLTESGNREKAVEIYDQIAAEGAAGDDLRDLAKVKAALTLIDLASPDEIRERVSSLVGSGSPFRFSAREAIALSAFAGGNLEQARNEFQLLAFDLQTPTNLKSRAQEMLIILGPPTGGDAGEIDPPEDDATGALESDSSEVDSSGAVNDAEAGE